MTVCDNEKSSGFSEQKPRATVTRSLTRFLLFVVSSFASNAILISLKSGSSFSDLGAVSKQLDAWWEVGGLVAWRAFELGVAWLLDLDAMDAVSFFSITNFQTFYLLSAFYNVRPTTIVVSYFTSTLALVPPMMFLRGRAAVHNLRRASPESVPNRIILQDYVSWMLNIILTSAILILCLYVSYATWIPTHLTAHFESIKDVRPEHAIPAGLPLLFLAVLLLGWRLYDFLFVSSIGAPVELKHEPSAGHRGLFYRFLSAMYQHTWGALSSKTKVLITRTVSLAAMVVLHTTVQLAGTIKGVDIEGAAGWGGVWAFAILVTGLVYHWVQGVEGV